MSAACQVDFYVLATPALDSHKLACRLALMAWERGHRIIIAAPSEDQARAIDELLWSFPPGRFVPHGLEGTPEAAAAPVRITWGGQASAGEVLINLDRQPVAEPAKFDRLLEIVPHRKADREASRDKYRYYRDQGLEPKTHDIAK